MVFRESPLTGCGSAIQIATASALAALLVVLPFSAPAAAAQFPLPDDLTVAVASGSRHEVRKAELNLGWMPPPLWQGENWRLRLRHEIVLGEWRVPDANAITELGYSPVLRLEHPGADGVFFVEGSIGARLLSHTWISPTTTLSTAFQFADMVGIGMQWGREPGAQTVGLRFQHQSNADIKKPNPGINFVMLYYRFGF
jgi:hypothetical protein